jgi:hypothetical protein
MALVMEIGDGSNTLFWKDRWLHGKKVKDIAPNICAMVPKRIANKQKASDALQNLNWTANFQGTLSVTMILEFMVLFQQVEEVTLQPGIPDTHIWRFSSMGQYSYLIGVCNPLPRGCLL